MGKYDTFSPQKPSSARQLGPHPIWRGVGFLLMVLIPILSYAIADLLVLENFKQGWFPISRDMLATPGQILYFAGPYIYVKLIVAAALAFVFFAGFSLLTFMINSMFGASRYGPYDMPPMSKPRGTKIRKAR